MSWPQRLKGWSARSMADAAFPNDKLMHRKLRDNFSHWTSGRSNPGPRFLEAMERVLQGGKAEPSPVNRIALAAPLELPAAAPKRAPAQFSFTVEADGQARISLNLLTSVAIGFRVMDALRGAGLLSDDSAGQ